jgi:hypothetical protein
VLLVAGSDVATGVDHPGIAAFTIPVIVIA